MLQDVITKPVTVLLFIVSNLLFLSKQPSTNCTLKSCSFAEMFRLPLLLLQAFILQFIPQGLFK